MKPATLLLVSGTLVWIAAGLPASPPLGRRSVHVHAGLLPSSRDARRTAARPSQSSTHACMTRSSTTASSPSWGRYSFGMFCLHMLVFPAIEYLMQPFTPTVPAALFAYGWLVAAIAVVATLATVRLLPRLRAATVGSQRNLIPGKTLPSPGGKSLTAATRGLVWRPSASSWPWPQDSCCCTNPPRSWSVPGPLPTPHPATLALCGNFFAL